MRQAKPRSCSALQYSRLDSQLSVGATPASASPQGDGGGRTARPRRPSPSPPAALPQRAHGAPQPPGGTSRPGPPARAGAGLSRSPARAPPAGRRTSLGVPCTPSCMSTCSRAARAPPTPHAAVFLGKPPLRLSSLKSRSDRRLPSHAATRGAGVSPSTQRGPEGAGPSRVPGPRLASVGRK